MGEFRYIHPDEMAKRHRAARSAPSRQKDAPRTPVSVERQPRQRNVESVLSLGDVRYFTYHRTQVFCIPTIPFLLGQRVLDSYTRALDHARSVARTGSRESADIYFEELYYLSGLLWSHIRPIGKVKRLFWRLGILRNPFRSASEGDLKEVTDFFLQGRMKSSVQFTSETAALK